MDSGALGFRNVGLRDSGFRGLGVRVAVWGYGYVCLYIHIYIYICNTETDVCWLFACLCILKSIC